MRRDTEITTPFLDNLAKLYYVVTMFTETKEVVKVGLNKHGGQPPKSEQSLLDCEPRYTRS